MRLTVALSALVLLACAALMIFVFGTSAVSADRPGDETPRTGIELLRAYQCRRAETKHIILRGVEDNFAPAGDEPTIIRDGRRNALTLSLMGGAAYDQYVPDQPFTDSLQTPSRIASGLFVISLRKVVSNANDSFSIGDLSSSAWSGPRGGRMFGTTVAALADTPGWRRRDTLYSAELSAIRLRPPTPRPAGQDEGPAFDTLLDYVRAGAGTRWVDVRVEDDTAVDFMGLAVCEQPSGGKGLTLARAHPAGPPIPGVTSMACRIVSDGDHVCDPYVGDTPCDTPLPLTCLRPGDRLRPRSTEDSLAFATWSGGEMAFTEPVRGDRFRTIADADRFCASRFGPDWRTAAFHDGIREGVAGVSHGGPDPRRAWIDIADQPYATCWTRR